MEKLKIKKGQLRAAGRTWIISYTDGIENFSKKIKDPNSVVEFCNDNQISISNKDVLITQYRSKLNY